MKTCVTTGLITGRRGTSLLTEDYCADDSIFDSHDRQGWRK